MKTKKNSYQKSNLSRMLGLGKHSIKMLLAADICSAEQLQELGSVRAFIKVHSAQQKPSLNFLWALEGALQKRSWIDISQNDRTTLLLILDELEHLHNNTDLSLIAHGAN